VASREELADTAARLFDRVERGVVKAGIGQTFALADVVEAHLALEARRTTGTTVLIP
jgi:NADPH2:quinone reductase